jgi:hypothetical protein
MDYRSLFELKTPAVAFQAIFDFAVDLTINETISSASTTATCYSGSDTSPSAIISGSAAISGKQVSQTIVSGLEGNTYLLTCTAATSLGQILVREGYLVVVANP